MSNASGIVEEDLDAADVHSHVVRRCITFRASPETGALFGAIEAILEGGVPYEYCAAKCFVVSVLKIPWMTELVNQDDSISRSTSENTPQQEEYPAAEQVY